MAADDALALLSDGPRTFSDLAISRETEEFLKPYSFEMLIRDSDDVCQVAVMIVKRLMSSDEANGMGQQFSREVLQIISDVVESVEARNRQESMDDDQDSNVVYWKELQQKYQAKLDEHLAALEQHDQEGNEQAIPRALSKAVYFHRLLEECKYKEKMTSKRALNLCLILLKQCRASISDQNLIDICQRLIMPALRDTEDPQCQVIGVESIGLLALLDKDLFVNYS